MMFKKFVSSLMSFLMVFQPLAANNIVYSTISLGMPYGLASLTLASMLNSEDVYAQIDGVAEAQTAANAELTKLRAGMPSMDSGRTTVTMPTANGNTATRASVTPLMGEQITDVAPASAAFGNNATFDGVVGGAVGRIATETSTQGEAYRTIKNNMRKRANYTNAAFLDPSKTAQDQPYAGCITTEVVTPGTGGPPLITYVDKTCSRVPPVPPTTCNVVRNYTISGGGTASVVGGEAAQTSASTATTTWANVNYSSGGYDQIRTVSIDWTKITSVELTSMTCDDDCAIWARDAVGGTWFPISATSTNGTNATTCGDRGGDITAAPPGINITSSILGIENLQLMLKTCVVGTGRSNAQITWNVNNPATYVDGGFIETPAGCWNNQYNDPFCAADSWTCNDSAQRLAGATPIDITMVKGGGGKAIWAWKEDGVHQENASFEASNVCWNADAAGLCNPTSGPIPCFTSANGIEICPDNTSGHADICQPLIDAGCVFQSETCMEGALSPTGTCYVYTSLYKCVDETLPTTGTPPTTTTTTTCGGTRCMGTECANGGNESNSDFGLLNGILGQVDSIGRDGDCDSGSCVLFKGKAIKCQTALGGLFDCCDETIPGINWVDYIQLAHGSYKILEMNGLLADMPSISGIASKALNGVVQSAGDLIGNNFMSSFDIASTGTSSLLPSGVSSLMSELVTQAGTWVTETFGADIASAFFTPSGTDAAQTFSLGAAPGSTAAAIMNAFVYIYVAYLILSIIFACDENEMELAASKQMKACHYVGTYCAGRALGWCYSRKQGWCCFGSALSRIMQEQIRKQILGWGSGKNPSCGGITPDQLMLVDWDLVDLSEYTAMMQFAEIKPSAGREAEFYGMENLTKSNIGGEEFSAKRGDGSPGLNAIESLEKATGSTATTGLDADDLRMDAVDDATSSLPP